MTLVRGGRLRGPFMSGADFRGIPALCIGIQTVGVYHKIQFGVSKPRCQVIYHVTYRHGTTQRRCAEKSHRDFAVILTGWKPRESRFRVFGTVLAIYPSMVTELDKLHKLVVSGEFHHATYRCQGTVWEGLWFYKRDPDGHLGFAVVGCVAKGPDLDAAYTLLACHRLSVHVGYYGGG